MKFVSFIHKVASKFDLVAWAGVLLMMIIVSINCIGRKLNMPLAGSYDLACFLLVIITAPSLANCGAKGGHTMLDMLTNKFSFKGQRVCEIIIGIICIAFCVLLTASLYNYMGSFIENGNTGSVLNVLVWPFILLECISVVVYIFVCVCDVIIAIDKLKKGEEK